jgi:hypothetical protein
MALGDAARDRVDLRAVADVARLRLGAELIRDALEALTAAREQDAAPAAIAEPAGDRLADPARPPCDDGYPRANVVSVPRLISTVSSIGSA